MRHYSSNTEKPHNIIYAPNSSAGILALDRSFIEIGFCKTERYR